MRITKAKVALVHAQSQAFGWTTLAATTVVLALAWLSTALTNNTIHIPTQYAILVPLLSGLLSYWGQFITNWLKTRDDYHPVNDNPNYDESRLPHR